MDLPLYSEPSIAFGLPFPPQQIFILVLILEDTDDLQQVLTNRRHPADLASILGELFANPFDHRRDLILVLWLRRLLPEPRIIEVDIFNKSTVKFVKFFPVFADLRLIILRIELADLRNHAAILRIWGWLIRFHYPRGLPILFWGIEVYKPADVPCLSYVFYLLPFLFRRLLSGYSVHLRVTLLNKLHRLLLSILGTCLGYWILLHLLYCLLDRLLLSILMPLRSLLILGLNTTSIFLIFRLT